MASQNAIATRQTQAISAPANPVTALFKQFDPSRYNVLAPITHMVSLPAGCRIVVTEVKINPDPAAKEVFPLPGGLLMPSKVSNARLAAAAGISWTDEHRQDNGKHPHYVEMIAKGRITDFDGTVREVIGTKAVDLREDAGAGESGKDYAEIVGKAKKGNRDPSQQLMEARKFIQEIAASKAENRAISTALGIKRGYTKEELSKPFIVPKLTIDTTNPLAQQAIMANMLGGINALFGSQPRVIDATFEEPVPAAALPADGRQAVEAPDALPASTAESEDDVPPLSEPDHDEATGEVTASPEQVKARTGAAYKTLKAAYPKLTNPEWTKTVKDSTGKADYTEMTLTDLDKLDAKVSEMTQLLGGGK